MFGAAPDSIYRDPAPGHHPTRPISLNNHSPGNKYVSHLFSVSNDGSDSVVGVEHRRRNFSRATKWAKGSLIRLPTGDPSCFSVSSRSASVSPITTFSRTIRPQSSSGPALVIEDGGVEKVCDPFLRKSRCISGRALFERHDEIRGTRANSSMADFARKFCEPRG